MVHVQRTFTVNRPADVVGPYLADFATAVEWEPGTQSCDRSGAGPVAVGSRWHNVSKVLGRSTDLEYTLERLDPDRITLVGRNDSATSTDDITVRAHPDGAEIVYDSNVELHGVAKLSAPVMKLEFEKLGGETEKGIQAAVAGLR